nr:MAG TPA: hypothetical protein [Caudoviricetes sp.]
MMFYLGYRKVLLQNGGGFQYIIEAVVFTTVILYSLKDSLSFSVYNRGVFIFSLIMYLTFYCHQYIIGAG